MFHHIENVTDTAGNVQPGWSVDCYVAGGDPATATAVTIYADRDATLPVPGNRVQADSDKAFVSFYIASGLYGRRYYDTSGVMRYSVDGLDMYGSDNADAAAASAVAAAAQAATATTQAGIATTQAAASTAQAVIATTQAGNAATFAANASLYEAAAQAFASGNLFANTTDPLTYGVSSLVITGNGTSGTNGTFAGSYTGGGGTGAAFSFVVSGGAVVPSSIVITNKGTGYTSDPTPVFSASAGLTGVTATLTRALRTTAGDYLLVVGTGNIYASLYKNVAGVITSQSLDIPSKALIDTAIASSFQTETDTPGGPLYTKDTAGSVISAITTDGGMYEIKRYRPGTVQGFNDKIDMHAEIDALNTAVAALSGVGYTTNTALLRTAVRTNGLFAQPSARAAANDIPSTFALGTASAASVITGGAAGSTTIDRTSTKLTYTGGVPAAAGTGFPRNGYYIARGAYSGLASDLVTPVYGSAYHAYEFNHTGTTFEIPILGSGGNPGGANFRMLVNGIDAGTVNVPSTGSSYYVRVVFPASALRKITIITNSVPTNGVNVLSTSEVTTTGKTWPVVTLFGDSFVEGTGAGGVGDMEAVVMARALGLSSALAGVGSTGMINVGGTNTSGGQKVAFTDTTRMVDLTLSGVTSAQTGALMPPSLGVVFGSLNDNGQSFAGYTSLKEAITARCLTLIDAWVAANSGKPLVFFGPTWPRGLPNDAPVLDIYRIRDGIAEAAFMNSSSSVYFIDRLMPQMREGIYSTTTTQAYLYTGGTTGTDTTHPTPNGHFFDGLYMANALRNLILGDFA